MSTADEKFAEVEKCYHDAVNYYHSDMAAARSAEEAAAIDQHYYLAQNAYNEALAKALVGNTDMIEAVSAALKTANEAVARLRHQNAQIAAILNQVGAAVSLATRLVLIAA
jgi:hypothetical protein